ncbi:MAG: DUF2617 family protein [Planctomycetes bacterium]|nr:DUF2617 family protein [Planctomycetota bacterium]
MNLPPKLGLQAYQTTIYGRALHPELFQLKGRKVHRHAGLELETWLLPAGHLLRLQHGNSCLSELLTDHEKTVPDGGILHSFICVGEHDYEKSYEAAGVDYIHSIQTETLSEMLYDATLDEMRQHTKDMQSLAYEWMDASGRCLSALDVQRHGRELHIQSYHLIATGGVVVRTQTIFEARR